MFGDVWIGGWKFHLYNSGRFWCAKVPGISGTYVETQTKQETLEKMTEIAKELSSLQVRAFLKYESSRNSRNP